MDLETLREIDLRAVPAYDIVDAARYLRMPKSTLRAWFLGQKLFARVLEPAVRAPLTLSFLNLAEAHILGAIRREHEVSLQHVRIALDTLHRLFPSSGNPLISRPFSTDGVDLFVQAYGELVNISRNGRRSLGQALQAHIRRVEWNDGELPTRLFPFTATSQSDTEARTVVIDPSIAFGRRVIFGTGIRTEIVAERYAAGERIDEIARDYGRSTAEIEDAIRSEFALAA